MANRTAAHEKRVGGKFKRTHCFFLYMGSALDMIYRGGRQGLISRVQVNKRYLAIRIRVADWSPASRGSPQVALVVKNPPANAGDVRDMGLIPGSGRPPGEGNDNPFQYSCLENSVDRGAWWAAIHGIAKESDTTEQLTHTHTHTHTFNKEVVKCRISEHYVQLLKSLSCSQRRGLSAYKSNRINY